MHAHTHTHKNAIITLFEDCIQAYIIYIIINQEFLPNSSCVRSRNSQRKDGTNEGQHLPQIVENTGASKLSKRKQKAKKLSVWHYLSHKNMFLQSNTPFD